MQEGFPEQLSTPVTGVDDADPTAEPGAEPAPPATSVVMVVDVGAPPMPAFAAEHGASATTATVAVVAAQGPVPVLPSTGSGTEAQVGLAGMLMVVGLAATVASRWPSPRRRVVPVRGRVTGM